MTGTSAATMGRPDGSIGTFRASRVLVRNQAARPATVTPPRADHRAPATWGARGTATPAAAVRMGAAGQAPPAAEAYMSTRALAVPPVLTAMAAGSASTVVPQPATTGSTWVVGSTSTTTPLPGAAGSAL